jgi:hypothetical protein
MNGASAPPAPRRLHLAVLSAAAALGSLAIVMGLGPLNPPGAR